jgi:protein-disulfide isomerase
MSRRQILIAVLVLAAVVLGIVGYVVFATPDSGVTTTAAGGGTTYKIELSDWDRPMGNPKAPVQMVEYAAPTCPICAHFDMTMFPALKHDYIDTGKVYYIFRVFPLSQVDVAADGMARCLPADNYFQFIDLLYRNQPKWDPDGHDIPDVHAALVGMGQIAGMSADQVDKCIGDQDTQKKVTAVGQYAQTTYGINATPTFIVNGEMAPYFRTSDDVKAYLDKVLAKKK